MDIERKIEIQEEEIHKLMRQKERLIRQVDIENRAYTLKKRKENSEARKKRNAKLFTFGGHVESIYPDCDESFLLGLLRWSKDKISDEDKEKLKKLGGIHLEKINKEKEEKKQAKKSKSKVTKSEK